MNFVFWIGIIIAAVFLWFCLSFAFKGIGGAALHLYAEANAEKVRIAADAEADANLKIARSLTSELIEKIKYERWNGELPTVSGGSAIVSIEEPNNEPAPAE